jgi:hypothetical protein
MNECKYKKSIQFYLDGYARGEAVQELEAHLKSCPDCQIEMAELIEVNGAALEIIDQAPDRTYWDSFNARVRNRIIARDVEPAEVINKKTPGFPILKLASVFMILAFITGGAILIQESGQRIQPVAITASNISTPEKGIESSSPSAAPLRHLTPELAANVNAGSQSSTVIPANNYSRTSANSSDGSNSMLRTDKKFAGLEIRDTQTQFRLSSFPGREPQIPSNESRLPMPSALADINNPAFRLKNAFIGQRILASLDMNTLDTRGNAIKNPSNGFSSASLSTNGDDPGATSTWGYLQVASDTSRTSETKKYLIELELMQNK